MAHRFPIWLVAFVSGLLAAGDAASETTLSVVSREGETRRDLPNGATVFAASTSASGATASPPVVSLSGAADRVIVELRTPPLVRSTAPNASRASRAARDALAAQHGRVWAEIRRLQGAARAAAGSEREFFLTFNGIATTLSPSARVALSQHPDVKAIHPDTVVEAVQVEDWGVTYVGAPTFWANHGGYRGAGMVIAVIDTGIDYTHADLGACVAVGGGCKVVGGFDFHNNDADPLDDHGHGTHVAGTAAGNGDFVGVAPDASLLGYKVLGADGTGSTSNVIAGVERAVDPNGDLDTSDHADVLNLSLGGPGNADDPGSQALDAATAAGAFVAVAAGNDGGYRTIGSPGSARTALTVGAVDSSSNEAGFTSGGPAAGSLDLKPEISAPGVGICAAQAAGTQLGANCTDATHISISGTSMATPHVAGAAALLRGVFPTLSVPEIKSLLVQNSAPLAGDALKIGAGALDVVAAAGAHTVVVPQVLSFGLDDVTQSTWIANETLTVKNLDVSSRDYDLSVAGHYWGLPAGTTVTFTPASFSLAPGASTSVGVQLTVDNTQVPDQAQAPNAYEGMVSLVSGAETQRIPLVFLKASLLRVHTDEAPAFILVHDRTLANAQQVGGTGTTTDILVPAGTWDVLVVFQGGGSQLPLGRFVLHENVPVLGLRNENVDASEASHSVTLAGTDENGSPIAETLRVFSVYHRASGVGVAVLTNDLAPPYALLSSSLSAAYDLDVGLMAHVGAKTYQVVNGTAGLSSDRAFVNTPAELTLGELRYRAKPGEVTQEAIPFFQVVASPFQAIGFGQTVPDVDRDLYLTKAPHAGFRMFVQNVVLSIGSAHGGPLHRGSTLPGVLEAFNFMDTVDAVYSTATGELPLNLGPASFFGKFSNSTSFVNLQMAKAAWAWMFHAQGGDGPNPPGGLVPWRLVANGAETATGSLPQSSFSGPNPPAFPIAQGGYLGFETDRLPYWMGGARATTHMDASFDTSRWPADSNPPYLTSVTVRSNGVLTDTVEPGATATIRLEAHDTLDEAGFTLTATRLLGGGESALTVTPLGGGVFEVVTACDLQAGPFNLALGATDTAGNELREWLLPAFVCRPSTCGNNAIEPGEACDDGNTAAGGGCNPICSSAEICGDGVLDATEECDDGNLADGDCCSSACQFEPAGSACADDGLFCNGSEACDASGTCGRHLNPPCVGGSACAGCNEATDLCVSPAGVVCFPAIGPCDTAEVCDGATTLCPADGPSQDIDGDGLCNATDPCTNLGGQTFITPPKARVRLVKINTDTAAGNDKVRVGGMFTLPPGESFANLQPDLRGARLVIQSYAGDVRLDATLATGTYAGAGTRGWQLSSSGRRWLYRDKTAAPTQGIVRMVVVNKDGPATPGLVKVVVVGKNGTYPVLDGDQPIRAIVGLGDQADVLAGRCGETGFTSLDCAFNGRRNALTCKR